MQRGIDSFFKRVPKEAAETVTRKKRKVLQIVSSDEDEVPESPADQGRKKVRTKSPLAKNSDKSPLKKSPEHKIKSVDPKKLFGDFAVRVEAKKPPKPKEIAIVELEDDEIDKSLMDVDVDDKSPLQTTDNGKSLNLKKQDIKPKSPGKQSESPLKRKKEVNDKEKKKTSPKSPPAKKSQEEKKAKVQTPKIEKKSTEKATPKSKKEPTDMNESVLSDEERHERKRMAAVLYQKYKNRSSCINPGSKEVPEGKPNCLAGLTFLVTGILESLERDEAGSIIKQYGGKVMGTVGKKLNYMIVGEEAGPKKLVQAEEFNVKVISEDGFFDLIREKSGTAVKSNGKVNDTEKPSTSPKTKKSTKDEVKIKEEKTSPLEKKTPKKDNKADSELNNNRSPIKQEKNSQSLQDKDVKKEFKPTVAQKAVVSEDVLAWVDKYKPTSIKEIIGQQGAASNVTKLMNWLSKWYVNHDGKKKLQKPNPWAKNDDGSFYKAALLSGPPGIGKTTTATLVCKELGFDAVEFNASDTRSKRLLKEEVSELLSNKSLYGYFHGETQAVTKKHVLIMDEVDGMAGNEDRGGMQELIGLIKESSVPIICMCNDRNHQKMRSLVNYCFDLRFNRPRLEQIKGRILSICFREHIKLNPAKVEEIIAATNNDIRQSINHISLLSAGKELNLKSDEVKSTEKIAEKDLKMGPWEVVRKVFSADEHKHMSLNDKCDLFFHDYSLAPLFVQQNYLQVVPTGPKSEVLQKVAMTADALSLGDLVDKRIRSNMAWSLLPTQAVFSSVMPGEYMCGNFSGQINFPGWLGKNSRANKRNRLAQELHDHTRLRTSGSRLSIRLDYAPFLLANIVRPLKELGAEGVESALNVLKEYHLLREDIDSLIELTTWPGKKSIMEAVDGRVKAALTRTYNKEVLAYTYSAAAGIKKKKAEAADDSALPAMEGEEDETVAGESDDEKDDDVENDGLIKAKKRTASAAASSSKAKPSTSKKATTTSKAKATSSKAKK